MTRAKSFETAIDALVDLLGGPVPITIIEALADEINAAKRAYIEHANSFIEFTFDDNSTITYGVD